MTRRQADEDPQNGSGVDLIEYLLIAMVVLLAAGAVPPGISTFFGFTR